SGEASPQTERDHPEASGHHAVTTVEPRMEGQKPHILPWSTTQKRAIATSRRGRTSRFQVVST
ncbi:MAG: hypothetical protein MUF40_00685, partial [Gemmatimonadaceae bacterium]|nr:hypothetical protein [Gemmatimonadaceae bacterium]